MAELIGTDTAAQLLSSYGWLPESPEGAASVTSGEGFANVLRLYQGHWNLPITGLLDGDTQKHLAKPRWCHHGDLAMSYNAVRGNRWASGELTYAWLRALPGMSIGDTVDLTKEVAAAINKAVPSVKLSFSSSGSANIICDVGPIDGQGQTLAYMFLPQGVWPVSRSGDGKFDNAERFAKIIFGQSGGGLLPAGLIILHEFMHGLGLPHAPDGTYSIMAPFLDTTHTQVDGWIKTELSARYGGVVPTPGGGGTGGKPLFPCVCENVPTIPPWLLDLLKTFVCPESAVDPQSIPWDTILQVLRCVMGKAFRGLARLEAMRLLNPGGQKFKGLLAEFIGDCNSEGIRPLMEGE